MTSERHPFAPRSSGDLARLVEHHPLAWIVSGAGESFRASLMPVRPWKFEDGRLTQLAGHLPRRNDQVDLLRDSPRAHLLFLGPHGYISPTWVTDRRWTPTWNFASARIDVEIAFLDDEESLRAVLEDLVDTMEAGRPDAWRIEEMGSRYAELARRIIAFRAHVTDVRERYKLGQDEETGLFADIVRGLEDAGENELKDWMVRFNSDRLKE